MNVHNNLEGIIFYSVASAIVILLVFYNLKITLPSIFHTYPSIFHASAFITY